MHLDSVLWVPEGGICGGFAAGPGTLTIGAPTTFCYDCYLYLFLALGSFSCIAGSSSLGAGPLPLPWPLGVAKPRGSVLSYVMRSGLSEGLSLASMTAARRCVIFKDPSTLRQMKFFSICGKVLRCNTG